MKYSEAWKGTSSYYTNLCDVLQPYLGSYKKFPCLKAYVEAIAHDEPKGSFVLSEARWMEINGLQYEIIPSPGNLFLAAELYRIQTESCLRESSILFIRGPRIKRE